jgi:hypothetical protein
MSPYDRNLHHICIIFIIFLKSNALLPIFKVDDSKTGIFCNMNIFEGGGRLRVQER